MNLVEFGRYRDDQIYQLINEGTAWTRKQIQDLFFDFPSGKRKCLERLQALVDAEKIKQWRRDLGRPSIYHRLGRRPTNIDHCLSINDVYVAFMKQKKDSQVVEWVWTYSIFNEMVIADAFITIYEGEIKKVVMLEVECDPRKKFVKPETYSEVFAMNWDIPLNLKEMKKATSPILPKFLPWVSFDSANKRVIFPTVLIVTDKDIEIPSERNPHNINFVIATTEEVKKDVYSLI